MSLISLLVACNRNPSIPDEHPENIGRSEIPKDSSWVEICEVLDEFLAEGIMKFQINDLYYEYRCAHCIGFGFQGEDPIAISPSNLKPFYEWCDRNKGKYPQIFFGDKVRYPEVEQIFRVLNERGFTFYLHRSIGDNLEIKADLYDGRFENEKDN